MRRNRNSPLLQHCQQLPLCPERQRHVVCRSRGVPEEAQWPLRRHRRIELPQASGRGVARVGKYRLAVAHAFFVHLLEPVERQIDLTPHFDPAFGSAARETKRDVTHGAKVFGHDLTDETIASRRSGYEHAVLVRQAHGRAVDLELHRVSRLGDVAAGEADEPLLPRFQLTVIEGVAEGKHRLDVGVFRELTLRSRADPHRRRVRCSQPGMLGLDLLQLAEELVVLAVRQRRPVEDIVLVRSPVKRFPQLRRLGLQIGDYLA